MRFDAVYLASDNQLKDELGIKELGVRLSLKAHCERLIKNQKLMDTKLEKEKEERNVDFLKKSSTLGKAKQPPQSKRNRSKHPETSGLLVVMCYLVGYIAATTKSQDESVLKNAEVLDNYLQQLKQPMRN